MKLLVLICYKARVLPKIRFLTLTCTALPSVECTFRQEVLWLGNEVAFNEAIIEEREQGFKDIQEQIVQANEIFKDLAVLVHEQGITIGKISNI